MIDLQPGTVAALSSALSCRLIGTKDLYLTSDIQYQCFTPQHIGWILSFILPIFLVWALIVPLILYKRLNKSKKNNHLNQLNFRLKYGFIFHEYRSEAYYWEIVKMIQKELIVIFLQIYQPFVSMKALFVAAVIVFYLIGTLRFRPYSVIKLNGLDK
jgi:hypothetical protein